MISALFLSHTRIFFCRLTTGLEVFMKVALRADKKNLRFWPKDAHPSPYLFLKPLSLKFLTSSSADKINLCVA